MALPAGVAGYAVYGAAVALLLRDADVAPRDPAGGRHGRGQSGVDAGALSDSVDPGDVLGPRIGGEEAFSVGRCGGGGATVRLGRPGFAGRRFRRTRPLGRAAGPWARCRLQPGASFLPPALH